MALLNDRMESVFPGSPPTGIVMEVRGKGDTRYESGSFSRAALGIRIIPQDKTLMEYFMEGYDFLAFLTDDPDAIRTIIAEAQNVLDGIEANGEGR